MFSIKRPLTLSQDNNNKAGYYQTSLKVRENIKSKQSLIKKSSEMRSSIKSSRKNMRKQPKNLRVTLDKQKKQSIGLNNVT